MLDFITAINDGARPSATEFVAELGPYIPLLQQLEQTAQDPQWHAEGNVLAHTNLVLQQVYQLLQNRARHLRGERRLALILAAALHDVAKPVTTKTREVEKTQQTISPGHEAKGCSYLAPLLMGHQLSYSLIELVLGLVRYHMEPKFFVLREKSTPHYYDLARKTDPELLYWLCLADIGGRHCQDQKQQLEYIELFALYAQEAQAWHRFAGPASTWRTWLRQQLATETQATQDLVVGNGRRDHRTGLISTPDEALAKSFAHRRSFAQVVYTFGLSGSGKSTWIKKHLKDHVVISLDQIRRDMFGAQDIQIANGAVVKQARLELRQQLRSHGKVCWDATNLRRDFRDAISGLGFDYHALVTLVMFHQPMQTICKRNQQRSHPVPEAVLDKQLAVTQWPELHEAHRVLVIGEDGLVKACYGCTSQPLPYGAAAAPDMILEYQP